MNSERKGTQMKATISKLLLVAALAACGCHKAKAPPPHIIMTGIGTSTITPGIGTMTVAANLAPKTYGPVVINAGVVGNKIADFQARVNADVIAQNPTIVIIEGSVNDLIGGTGTSTYQSQATALLSTITTALPTVKIMWVGIFCYGESYPDTNWGAQVDAYNAANVSATATVSGATYVDIRTPQQVYESINNTPPPGAISGVMTADAVHPNTAIGIPVYSNTAFASVTLVGAP